MLYVDFNQPVSHAILWLFASAFDKSSEYQVKQTEEQSDDIVEVNPIGSLPTVST
jgi:hypothetical protein